MVEGYDDSYLEDYFPGWDEIEYMHVVGRLNLSEESEQGEAAVSPRLGSFGDLLEEVNAMEGKDNLSEALAETLGLVLHEGHRVEYIKEIMNMNVKQLATEVLAHGANKGSPKRRMEAVPAKRNHGTRLDQAQRDNQAKAKAKEKKRVFSETQTQYKNM